MHKQNYNVRDEQTARLYGIWHNMNQRCYNPKHTSYHYYGARGIEVCDLWRNTNPYGFACFVSWAWQNGYNDTLTIDRINNNGNYEPSNCQWADMKEQSRNTRRNHPVIVNGVQYGSLAEAIEALNRMEDYEAIRDRITRYRYTPQEAFDKPIAKERQTTAKPITIDNKTYKSIRESCKALGLKYNTVKQYRRRQNCTNEEAIYHYMDKSK